MGSLVLVYLLKEDGCCSCTREPQVVENRNIFEMKNNEKILLNSKYLMISMNEDLRQLYDNRKNNLINLELLKKIDEENKQLYPKVKAKIEELFNKQYSQIVEIGRGNSCNNPCYQYNYALTQKCPKCGGKVEEDFENDYTTSLRYDEYSQTYKEFKDYSERKICTGVILNNNIGKEDVDLDELFKYFEKVDNEKKCHYIVNINGITKEYDRPYHYMMIDGERYYFPYGIGMEEFFLLNEYEFFPRQKSKIPYSLSVSFFHEQQMSRKELGQSLGYYGYAWKHFVFIFTCNLCGHKYHIIRTSPFAFRDKSKDVK